MGVLQRVARRCYTSAQEKIASIYHNHLATTGTAPAPNISANLSETTPINREVLEEIPGPPQDDNSQLDNIPSHHIDDSEVHAISDQEEAIIISNHTDESEVYQTSNQAEVHQTSNAEVISPEVVQYNPFFPHNYTDDNESVIATTQPGVVDPEQSARYLRSMTRPFTYRQANAAMKQLVFCPAAFRATLGIGLKGLFHFPPFIVLTLLASIRGYGWEAQIPRQEVDFEEAPHLWMASRLTYTECLIGLPENLGPIPRDMRPLAYCLRSDLRRTLDRLWERRKGEIEAGGPLTKCVFDDVEFGPQWKWGRDKDNRWAIIQGTMLHNRVIGWINGDRDLGCHRH